MSAIVEPIRQEWIALIRRYLNNEIDEATFGAAHQELRRRHLALEAEKVNAWSERYDVQIQQDYFNDKISLAEFTKGGRSYGEKRQNGRSLCTLIFSTCSTVAPELKKC